MTSVKFYGISLPLGGGYSRLYPTTLNKSLIKKSISHKNTILYFHPWEFLNTHPISPRNYSKAFRHHLNIGDNLYNKLDSIMKMNINSLRIIDVIN